MASLSITKSRVDGITLTDRTQVFWDTNLKGFGVKVTPSGAKTYIFQYRTPGGRRGQTRRITIGRHGNVSADLARSKAKEIFGQVFAGEDPSAAHRSLKSMPTVSELCDRYLLDGVSTKKESTLSTDRGRIQRHIKPLLGKKLVSEVNQADIRKFLKDVADGATAVDERTKSRGRAIVKGGKGTASRTLGLLGGIFSYACELGLTETNPTHGVKRFPDRRNERFLSTAELALIGTLLREAQLRGTNPNALAIIKLLIFTGARRGEIEGLEWREVDLDRRLLRLSDSKTGQKVMPLNSAAVGVLQTLKARPHSQSGYVFPASSGEGHFVGTSRVWQKLRKSTGVEDVRLHDLRHSFASVGVQSGTPLMIVGALLGHSNHSTTQRYAHLADNPIAAASEEIGILLSRAFEGEAQE